MSEYRFYQIMKNYRLTIQYNGKKYSGWQIQPNVDTIQQQISDAIQIITKEKINLIGSGRTDAGVHALGQVANFCTNSELNLRKFQHSLNSILPNEISIKDICEVEENFHARFDAKKRSYLYIINSLRSPFYNDFAYFYPPISKHRIEHLNSISSKFIGEFDYTSFAKKNSDKKDMVCDITLSRWRKTKEFYFFRIDGDRFLHGMVRTIIGTILDLSENNQPETKVGEIMSLKDRGAAGMGVPANGLFLYKVKY